jgi:hypothetical protein
VGDVWERRATLVISAKLGNMAAYPDEGLRSSISIAYIFDYYLVCLIF